MKNTATSFSIVRNHNRNNDLTKKWYVSYGFKHPITGKMERVRVYADLNKYTSIATRTKAMKLLNRATRELLQEGFNPFARYEPKDNNFGTIGQALDYVLKVKQKRLKDTSYKSLKPRILKFKKFMWGKGLLDSTLNEIKKNNIAQFLDSLEVSNRTRNNYLVDLHGAFELMIDTGLTEINPCARIKKLKIDSHKNKPFSAEQINRIKAHLAEVDPLLWLFIRVGGYSFLRPQEVANLQVKHIDLAKRTIRIDTKGKNDKVKIIIEKIYTELQNHVSEGAAHHFLFTPNGLGAWITTATSRRDYWSKRFNKVVKKPLGLGHEYGLYSFRHNCSIDLYQAMISTGMVDHEAKYKMLPITGHQSIKALENYLRDIGAELPNDYSNLMGIL